MTDYNLIGIQNFVSSNLEKLLKSAKIEERVKEGLIHNDIDKITQLTYEKIIDKLSNILSEEFIKQLKKKEEK